MKITKFTGGPIGVNAYVVVDEKTKDAFIVDPGFFDNRIESKLTEEDANLKYIVLTHGHGDHICGVEMIKEKYGAKVIAHKDEKKMLNDSRYNFSEELCRKRLEFDADIYVDDSDSLMIGEMDLKFIHTPGHSEGGMCVLIDSVLFSGDTLFRQSVGRTDIALGSTAKLRESIRKKLFVLPEDVVVYPGHMDKTDIGYEKRNNPFV